MPRSSRNRLRLSSAAIALSLLAFAAPARADPCKAIPDKGPLPAWLKPGKVFNGTVRYIGDGDSLCIGSSADTSTWVEVRLVDFDAPELGEPGGRQARDALSRIALGRPVRCVAGSRSWDRVVAKCTLNGRPIGDLLRAAGVAEGGR
jgi:endonuclease YncB( thermonuclease family)